jgi:tripartite-type tricarboxylate transporter receptor subunit TctC
MISEDLRAVMGDAAMKKRLQDIASYTTPMSPAELRNYIRGEQALWKPVIEKIPAFNASAK